MHLKNILLSLILLTSFFLISLQSALAQMTREQYIETYSQLAIDEMHQHGIPASITMAQALLESNNGNSDLATKAKNHFGIKCNKNWEGKTYHMDDDAKDECFRRYESIEDSYKDHSIFLKRERYAELYTYDPMDYVAWAKGLKKFGYATNPSYAEILIKIIEDFKLYQLDDGTYQKEIVEVPVFVVEDEPNSSLDNFFADQKKRRKRGTVDPDGFVIEGRGHEVSFNNRIKYIITKPGDTFESINKEFDLIPFQLPKYNELSADAELKESQILYLQPKRSQAENGKTYHEVIEGDDWYAISQIYGIKLKKLYKLNGIAASSPLKPGDKVKLRK